jgi:hypothetical protein
LTFLLLRHGERVLLVLGREPGGEGRRGVDEVVVPVGSGGVVGFDFEERLSDEAGEGFFETDRAAVGGEEGDEREEG